MKKLRFLVIICMGIVLAKPMPCIGTHTVIKAVEDAPTVAVPANISIKTGQPSAQMQIEVKCTSAPSIETQTQTLTANNTGRATVRYDRVEGMTYTITLTVNGVIYTMKDDTVYESTCDTLTVEGIRAGVDDEGVQTLTVTVSLADVPETKLEPEKPEPPTEDDEQKKENKKNGDTPKKEDAQALEKDTLGDSAQVQKVEVDSTIAQGMPTGCSVWNPVSWFLNLFRV